MQRLAATLLVQYRYDPVDRLADCVPADGPGHQRFYQKNRLATEIQGSLKLSFFQQQDCLLAQHQQGSTTDTLLLATDWQRSVLNVLERTQRSAIAYTPYGLRTGGLSSVLGFNGERAEPVTGHYVLGNGYRVYNPVLMRFNSPDSWSPFGRGGLNTYAYCIGDPVNKNDRSGHTPMLLKSFLRGLGLMRKSAAATNVRNFKTTTFKATTSSISGESDVLLGYHGSVSPDQLRRTGYFNGGEVFVTSKFEFAQKYAGKKGAVFAAYVDRDELSSMSARYAPKTNASSFVPELPISVHEKNVVKAIPTQRNLGDVDLDDIYDAFGRTHEERHQDVLQQLYARLKNKGVDIHDLEKKLTSVRNS